MSSEGSLGKRSEIELFAAAAAAVARGDDLDDALAELLGLAAEELGAKLGAVYILDQDLDELELTVTFGIDIDAVAAAATVPQLGGSTSPLAVATRQREPVALDDASQLAIMTLAGSVASALVVPMVVRRDGIELALGVLVLGFAGLLPAPDRRPVAESIADLAAVAVERALALSLGSERAEWFERLAHTDPLTGLANRRTFDRMLELELARAGRQSSPLSVVLFEVDRIDTMERSVGHAAADDVLKRVAQVLAESVRLVDTVARYGGSEFVLVAPGPDGNIVAERLVNSISGLTPLAGQPITVSAGIAHFPTEGRTTEDLIAVAHQAVAKAREAGGGTVVTLEGGE